MNSIALADRLGVVYIEAAGRSRTSTHQVLFGLYDVCVGWAGSVLTRGSARDTIPDVTMFMMAPLTCIPYADASVARLAPLVPYGEPVLTAVC